MALCDCTSATLITSLKKRHTHRCLCCKPMLFSVTAKGRAFWEFDRPSGKSLSWFYGSVLLQQASFYYQWYEAFLWVDQLWMEGSFRTLHIFRDEVLYAEPDRVSLKSPNRNAFHMARSSSVSSSLWSPSPESPLWERCQKPWIRRSKEDEWGANETERKQVCTGSYPPNQWAGKVRSTAWSAWLETEGLHFREEQDLAF